MRRKAAGEKVVFLLGIPANRGVFTSDAGFTAQILSRRTKGYPLLHTSFRVFTARFTDRGPIQAIHDPFLCLKNFSNFEDLGGAFFAPSVEINQNSFLS